MGTRTPNFGLGIEGELCGCEAQLMVAREDGDWSYTGKLYARDKNIGDLLPAVDANLAKTGAAYADFIGKIQAEVIVSHRKGKSYLKIQSGAMAVTALSAEEGALLTASFKRSEVSAEKGIARMLQTAVNQAGAFLGIEQLVLFLKRGNLNISGMKIADELTLPQNMSLVSDSDIFVYGKFDFRQSNILFKEIFYELFGLGEMEAFVAYRESVKEFACYMAFPLIDNKLLKCQDMHFYLIMGNAGNQFGISGTFCFHFLGDMEFSLDCAVGTAGFSIAASSKAGQKFELIPGFYIQDTTLLIGYNTGFTFGLITRIGIRKLELFAGIKLTVYGEIVNLSLITAAIHKVTISLLADNLLGVHIPGIEMLDFIAVNSFELKLKNKYQKGKDIVDYINQNAIGAEWKLGRETTQIREQHDGIAILDEQRMCHYFIDEDGVLSLQAQFYYATETCKLGPYQIKKGIFVCAVITIFGKSIKALLSAKEGEGIVAFAQIDEMDLGFLKISASSVSAGMENPMLADGSNTMLAKFVESKEKSAVFFLSANKKDVSFYVDGRIDVCSLFVVDARIIYMKGLIAVDVSFSILQALDVYLKLKVDYRNFTNGSFQFYLLIDTRKLEAKLTAVKEKINAAIEKCRKAINNATKELDDAKEKVNNLYCQIDSLDRKIADCKREINDASWWKRWAVAIYKGAEILAYEVAKGALYVAIGTAKAVLEVAKAAVQFGGIMGEGILQIAKGVVDAALNLFFLRKIELAIDADKNKQSIGARIEFVALGKEYKYETTFTTSIFGGKPEDAIADNINRKMEKDLENIDKGSFKANRDKYRIREDLRKDRERLQTGMGELNRAMDLISQMQQVYVEETKEMMPDFEILNGEYARSLSEIENTMSFVSQSIDIESLQKPMETLHQAVEQNGEIDVAKAEETLEKYREAQASYAQMQENIAAISAMRNALEKEYMEQRDNADSMMQAGETSDENALETVVNTVEDAMCTKHFRATPKNSGFLNLTKESAIAKSFERFREINGYETPETIREVRKKTRNMSYSDRI